MEGNQQHADAPRKRKTRRLTISGDEMAREGGHGPGKKMNGNGKWKKNSNRGSSSSSTVLKQDGEGFNHGGYGRMADMLRSCLVDHEYTSLDSAFVSSDEATDKFVSFSLPGKVSAIFSAFNDEKKGLVESIGFGGLLRMPVQEHLHEKFSYWLLKNLDIETMAINMPKGFTLPITDVDVHMALGIPFGGLRVHHDNNLDHEVVSIVTRALGFGRPGARLTLEYLEEVLTRDYGEIMLEEEKLAFKIAVVMFSMAYFLGVYQPIHRFPVWLLRNFTGTNKISDYNWSGYLLSIIAHAAAQVQKKNNKRDTILLYGCTFFLQIFYLDNLNFGAFSTLHLDMPRVCVFKPELLQRLINLDIKIRNENEVCYSRSWTKDAIEKWKRRDESFEETTVLIHEAMSSRNNALKKMRAAVFRLGSDIATSIKINFNFLHEGYKPIAEPCNPAGIRTKGTFKTLRLMEWGYKMKYTRVGQSLMRDGPPFWIDGRKIVARHSEFDESPFELEYYHPSIPRRRKMAMYNWFTEGRVTLDELFRWWLILNVSTNLKISGLEIKSSLTVNGGFSVVVCNAIMRLFNQLDDYMYLHHNFSRREHHRRWRHFICPSFAEAVLKREDYLKSYEVSSQFVGAHIGYDVENCTMFILPVLYDGKWSCYFWNFETRTITVLDPTMMDMLSLKVDFTHDEIVEELHDALFACIESFFQGWDVDKEDWKRSYPTHISSQSRKENSGLYSVHYARTFDGENLHWRLNIMNDNNLTEARSDILYFLLTMDGNEGYMPPDLKKQLEEANKRRFLG